jgi:hypothetical protein
MMEQKISMVQYGRHQYCKYETGSRAAEPLDVENELRLENELL